METKKKEQPMPLYLKSVFEKDASTFHGQRAKRLYIGIPKVSGKLNCLHCPSTLLPPSTFTEPSRRRAHACSASRA